MRFATLLLVSILLISIIGCGAANKVVGMYDGTVRVSVPKPAVVGGTGTGDRVQVLDQKVTLNLRADQTFTEDLGQMVIEGKWMVEGTQLTLSPDKVRLNGQLLPREIPKMYNPVVMTLEGDKIALRREGEEYVFTKKN
jgi:hypothetical protein